MAIAYRVPTSSLPKDMVDDIVSYILSVNEHITLRQIKDGIGYGWYYIDDEDLKPMYKINEYNQHQWKMVDDIPF